jgi:HAE1 family hydrophobic/amphiphilic exporter-1
MQKLAEICIHRPIFATMLVLALVVVGAAAYFHLGVDRFPAMDLPTVTVRTTLPGASPEDVETEVSDILEEAVNTVAGITELRSISGNGSSIVLATFELDRDIESAAQDVRDRVQAALRRLPPGTDPPVVLKQDSDSRPVITLALSAPRSVRELSEIAENVVKSQLERAEGVGEVRVVGGEKRAIKIWVDGDRLALFNLPVTSVRDAIARQNSNLPGGSITSERTERTLRTMGRVRDVSEFKDIVVARSGASPVHISDIGRVEDGTYEQRSLARLDGVPTVILEVRRQSGANTVAVIDAVKENLTTISSQLPSDLKLAVISDQSRYIHAALHEINLHLVLGSVLACLVVLLFMRSWRSTLIAGVAIPTSVVATFGMMWALHFTLNGVTMLALVLMVGIVIDDAIVVLENIFRFVEEKKLEPFEAAKQATREIGLAVLATTLSLVVIFVPVSFMSSISGRFLYQFGITAAVAVLVSLFVSFSLTPMMSARLFKKEEPSGHEHKESRGGLYGYMERGYMRMLALCMRHRAFVALFALLVVASSFPLYRLVKQEYLPSDVDESEFEVRVTAPLDASLASMDEVMRRVDRDIRSVPGVTSTLVQAGGSFLGDLNAGQVTVKIAPHEQRTLSITRVFSALLAGDPGAAFRGNYSQRDVMLKVRKKLRKYSDLRASVRNFPSFNIGGGNYEIDFSIRGPDLGELARYTDALRARADELGIADADTTLRIERPEERVIIDRERAAALGVRTEDVALTLRLMVGGDERVSVFRDEANNENYDVQLRLEPSARTQVSEVERLFVPRTVGDGVGQLARLDNLVHFESVRSASRIDRLDRQRVASLRAAVAPGYALADRLDTLRQAAKELDMPASYSVRVMGRGRELERTFDEFVWAFLLSIAFMYMILAAQFESLVHPCTILVSLPLSVPFALFSLWASENTLNLYSALGILVLFGVVKKNAILQVDHMNKLRREGMPRLEAILEGNRDRLRPILMTTLTLVAGMLPLWLGTGPGAEERRAIAAVVIGGQSLSLLLTLLVTPVAYSLFDDLKLPRFGPSLSRGVPADPSA